jgi:hypothetical protein
MEVIPAETLSAIEGDVTRSTDDRNDVQTTQVCLASHRHIISQFSRTCHYF